MRPNSGAVEGAKGDGVIDDLLWEAKSTVKRTLPLEHHWLAKIAKEARDVGKTPILTLSFANANGTPIPSGEWVCLTLADFQLLMEGRGE